MNFNMEQELEKHQKMLNHKDKNQVIFYIPNYEYINILIIKQKHWSMLKKIKVMLIIMKKNKQEIDLNLLKLIQNKKKDQLMLIKTKFTMILKKKKEKNIMMLLLQIIYN